MAYKVNMNSMPPGLLDMASTRASMATIVRTSVEAHRNGDRPPVDFPPGAKGIVV